MVMKRINKNSRVKLHKDSKLQGRVIKFSMVADEALVLWDNGKAQFVSVYDLDPIKEEQ